MAVRLECSDLELLFVFQSPYPCTLPDWLKDILSLSPGILLEGISYPFLVIFTKSVITTVSTVIYYRIYLRQMCFVSLFLKSSLNIFVQFHRSSPIPYASASN